MCILLNYVSNFIKLKSIIRTLICKLKYLCLKKKLVMLILAFSGVSFEIVPIWKYTNTLYEMQSTFWIFFLVPLVQVYKYIKIVIFVLIFCVCWLWKTYGYSNAFVEIITFIFIQEILVALYLRIRHFIWAYKYTISLFFLNTILYIIINYIYKTQCSLWTPKRQDRFW